MIIRGLPAQSLIHFSVVIYERIIIMTLKEKTLNSAKELSSVFSLTAIGMLLALRIILGIFANSTMALFGNMVKISLNFLPIAIAAAMFGPICAALIGGLGDVLSFFLNSAGGTYFPGFTLNGIITGLILGYFTYVGLLAVFHIRRGAGQFVLPFPLDKSDQRGNQVCAVGTDNLSRRQSGRENQNS